ncbi:MAG: CDP-diacylglycerol--glycerol-3-phosphate 3-phosphatidyltransferase [Clostridia bacterium]|nr:CDP-diacylglycerol--glycerol-3-phosphate 3-phosphatidyltransferase [Clostridia bacterium]
MNLPNQLTLLRMIMIPVFLLFFYLNFKGHYFVAIGVFFLASLTDLFDGKIARKYNLITNLGKFLDPIADKVLVLSALVVLLTQPWIFNANLGSWAIIVAGCGVAVILAREIIVSGFRMVAADAGIVIAADMIGKYKTVMQDVAVIILIIGAGFAELLTKSSSTAYEVVTLILNYVGLGCFAISVVLTVVSGINYVVKNIEVIKR